MTGAEQRARVSNLTVAREGRRLTRQATIGLAEREAVRRATFDTRRDPYYRSFWEAARVSSEEPA